LWREVDGLKAKLNRRPRLFAPVGFRRTSVPQDCRGRPWRSSSSAPPNAPGSPPDVFAGHSLRAGLTTSAAAAGVPERHIMGQTGHTWKLMVRRYLREGELFSADNPASRVGL